MYEDFFGFSEGPFGLNPDPRFLYMAPGHFEAFSAMLAGIKERKGITVITGEVGVGKTTLIHAVLQDLDEKIKTAFVFFTKFPFPQLLRNILLDLGLPAREADTYGLLQDFYQYLSERLAQNDTVAIIVDEAQNLEVEVLKDLLRLTTRSGPSSAILQLVLVGQPEFEAKLDSEKLRDLREKTALRRRIRNLDMEESKTYIDYRLKVVGGRSAGLFEPDAVERICSFAGGIPRVINMVCDAALLNAYARSTKKIDNKIVREVLRDLSHLAQEPEAEPRKKKVPSPAVKPVQKKRPHRSKVLVGAIASSILLVLILLVFFLFEASKPLVKGPAAVTPVQEERAGTKKPDKEGTEVRHFPTVRAEKGSTLLQLAKRHYHYASPTVVDVILEANPDITDVHFIRENRKIVMPPLTETSFLLPGPNKGYKLHLRTYTGNPSIKVFETDPVLKGKTIEVVPRNVSPRETWYRVVAGTFVTKEEGMKCLRVLRTKGIVPDFSQSAD